jgi:hypothetical protein
MPDIMFPWSFGPATFTPDPPARASFILVVPHVHVDAGLAVQFHAIA